MRYKKIRKNTNTTGKIWATEKYNFRPGNKKCIFPFPEKYSEIQILSFSGKYKILLY